MGSQASKSFGESERAILELFEKDTKFELEGETYIVNFVGKPTCPQGEPKTDIYIEAHNTSTNEIKEIKISYKKENADFIENKISKERAEQLFGEKWEEIIKNVTTKLRPNFQEKKLIYKSQKGRTQKGSITLGWKFELTNKRGGELCAKLDLTQKELIDVYAGTNLDSNKKNATVNNRKINNSGVANYILISNEVSSINSVIDLLQPINDYVETNPELYCVCKALNYRTLEAKFDGNRPLAVSVDWTTTDSKLSYNLNFETPLTKGGNIAYAQLRCALNDIKSKNTNDLNENNVANYNEITYQKKDG